MHFVPPADPNSCCVLTNVCICDALLGIRESVLFVQGVSAAGEICFNKHDSMLYTSTIYMFTDIAVYTLNRY